MTEQNLVNTCYKMEKEKSVSFKLVSSHLLPTEVTGNDHQSETLNTGPRMPPHDNEKQLL